MLAMAAYASQISYRHAARLTVVETRTATIFAFRGSATIQEATHYLLNSNMAAACFDTQVHNGVLREYAATVAPVVQLLKKEKNRLRIFAGHSMGGCIAQLAALDMGADACYSFGAPGTGDTAFVRALEARVPETYLVNTNLDLIATNAPFINGQYSTARDYTNTLILNTPVGWTFAPHAPAAYVAAISASVSSALNTRNL